MRNIIMSLLMTLVFVVMACEHIPDDQAGNYAKLGFYNTEFDVKVGDVVEKQMGVASIALKEDQALEGAYVDFIGIYRGTLRLLSEGCPVNYSVNFNGRYRILLKDIMPTPMNCTIQLVAETEQINGLEHNIVELGKLDFFVIGSGNWAVHMSYYKSSPFGLRLMDFVGNGNIQKMEGGVSLNEKITVRSLSNTGTYVVTNSCGLNTISADYSTNTFDISFQKLYGKQLLVYQKDSCDFFIVLIPDDQPKSFTGKFSINVYNSLVVPLEFAYYSFTKMLGNWRLNAYGNDHIAATAINEKTSALKKSRNDNKTTVDYRSGQVYWIRAITVNGRKSVFAVQNKQVIWW